MNRTKFVRMRGLVLTLAAIAVLLFGVTKIFGSGGDKEGEGSPMDSTEVYEGAETAVLAGGCFWGVEAVFENLNGVLDAMSGYAGGSEETASYYAVGTGKTGHAESVKVIYDPDVIEYRTLLEVFFRVAHDPTQFNYQGPDIGTEYRSVVFYNDDEQKKITEEYIAELAEAGVYSGPIVTEVVPAMPFYPAEEYHQDFLVRHPDHPYIVYWDMPKLANLARDYPELLVTQE